MSQKEPSLVKSYLHEHRFPALLFLLFALIFAFVFHLCQLETEAVLYAGALCLLCAAIALVLNFFSYRKKHQDRRRLLMDILLSSGELPAPATLAEADYEAIISCLRTALNESTTLRQTERQESLDYYTAWVHQIKTPVSVMKMILESEDTEEHRELLAELFRIEQYVEMVLSYLRLGSSTSDYVFAEYDLDPIIRQAIRKYAPQFIRRKLRLVYTPTDVSVLTDEKWLLFIIEQVLSNSIKYTPAGGSVTISIVDGGVLRISDTGIGIAPEDLPRIFEKGFTGYNGRADKKSTGLGLYLCQTAASRLSHTITATSVPGQGTVITLDLRKERLQTE